MFELDENNIYDICIIGGGINGAGVANYAAKAGLKVYLCEKNDFASETSSNSTKLIHGGLRYLEHFEFSLVRSALQERTELEQLAPYLIYPMEFIFINNPKIRNKWLVRLGLFLYDLLAGFKNKYPKTKTLDLLKHPYGNELDLDTIVTNQHKSSLTGYVYTDLWADDARLTLLNVLAAQENGAVLHKNTSCLKADFNAHSNLWDVILERNFNKNRFKIKSKYIVNAAGPFVNEVLTGVINLKPNTQIRLVKGSHIVVPRLYPGKQCYVLQHHDNRIIFTIPYLNQYTLIGTTEEEYNNLNIKPNISDSEKEYLINLVNSYFKKKLSSNSIFWSYSGIRPLLDNPGKSNSQNTRDYLIDKSNKIPLINIYGGKITTYRKLAKQVISELGKYFNFNVSQEIYHQPLPGRSIDVEKLIQEYPNINTELLNRYAVNYGNKAYQILNGCNNINDLGHNYGADFYQRELDYLIEYELADSVDDVLWRRTKLGLVLSQIEKEDIRQYIINKNSK